MTLCVKNTNVEENFENGYCTANIYLYDLNKEIKGTGKGVVDAFFRSFFDTFSEEYQSLKSIELSRFIVKTDHRTKEDSLGATAACEVLLEIKNSEGKRFEFKSYSRSLTKASVNAVASVAEYFINSERAYTVLWKSLKDAQERNRQDLVEKYTSELATVADNTSYTALISDLKK